MNEGLYDIKATGQVDIAVIRPYVTFGIWLATDTIGTDDPIAVIPTQYVRGGDDDQKIIGYGDIQINADDTEVQVAAYNLFDPDTTPSFTLDAGAKLYFSAKGSRGADATLTDVVGQLVATATMGVGTYVGGQLIGWTLDPGRPTGITASDYDGVINADLNTGIQKRLADRHVGWLVQCKT